MDKKVAGQIVAPLWNELMTSHLAGKPNEPFNAPDPLASNLKPVLRGIWQGGETTVTHGNEYVARSVHSILYWVDKENPLGASPSNPYSDGQFRLWEAPVRAWATSQGLADDATAIPTNQRVDRSPTSSPSENSISVEMTSLNSDGYKKDDMVTLAFEADSSNLKQVDFFINTTLIYSTTKSPFKYTFIPSDIDGIEASNEVRVVVYDKDRNRGEARSILLIK